MFRVGNLCLKSEKECVFLILYTSIRLGEIKNLGKVVIIILGRGDTRGEGNRYWRTFESWQPPDVAIPVAKRTS